MHNVTIKILLFAISLTGGLAPCGVATAGGRGTAVPPSPMIMKTAVDVKANILIITGRNFGATLPTVTLADQALDVKGFSEYEVVASLPLGLTPATYGVIVTTSGRNQASSNLFSAALPATTKK